MLTLLLISGKERVSKREKNKLVFLFKHTNLLLLFFSGKIMENPKLFDILVGCVLTSNMFIVYKARIYGL